MQKIDNHIIETDAVEANSTETATEPKPTANKKKPKYARRTRNKATAHAHNAARGIQRIGLSIPETCAALGFSERSYYNLAESERPKKIKVGRRVLHSAEAIAEWLREREK